MKEGKRAARAAKTRRDTAAKSCRALARALGRSPSHICRVMRGERVSHRLAAELAKRGVKVRRAK